MPRKKSVLVLSVASVLSLAILFFSVPLLISWARMEPEPKPTDISEAVFLNDVGYVIKWLKNGGNPNFIGHNSESLLYTATGPHGGQDVLVLLLNAGANPNLGMGTYTPLMNAASWCDLASVNHLIQHGADPNLRNIKGQTALDLVGHAGGQEKTVIDILAPITKH